MILTETAAKEKLCPFIRDWIYDRRVVEDELPPLYEHIKCRASECMAWVWSEAPDGSVPRHQLTGYCGMARRGWPL